MKDFRTLPMSERGKARREFVRANRHRMSTQELAIAIQTGIDNVHKIYKVLDGKDRPAPKKGPTKHSGYAGWECHKKRPYLADNYGGCF